MITSTASSVVSNVVTLISSVVATLLLSPLLTAISLAVTPVRPVQPSSRTRAAESSARCAGVACVDGVDHPRDVVGIGILLATVFGRQAHEVDCYRVENANQAELQVRQAMVGRSFFAVTQAFLGISPALVYRVAGLQGTHGDLSAGTLVAFTTLQSRLLIPINQLLQRSSGCHSAMAVARTAGRRRRKRRCGTCRCSSRPGSSRR